LSSELFNAARLLIPSHAMAAQSKMITAKVVVNFSLMVARMGAGFQMVARVISLQVRKRMRHSVMFEFGVVGISAARSKIERHAVAAAVGDAPHRCGAPGCRFRGLRRDARARHGGELGGRRRGVS